MLFQVSYVDYQLSLEALSLIPKAGAIKPDHASVRPKVLHANQSQSLSLKPQKS